MCRILIVYDERATSALLRHNPKHPAKDEVLAAGPSSADAFDIARELRAIGHEAELLALGEDNASRLSRLSTTKPDLVFNLCDTIAGRGDLAVAVPAFCELAGLSLIGASSVGIALSKRKHDIKSALVRAGIPTPRYQVLETAHDCERFRLELEPPVIVKPTAEHASVGIEQASLALDGAGAALRARFLMESGLGAALIEEYVDGDEYFITVAGDPPRAFAPVASEFHGCSDGFPRVRTFDVKWFWDPAASGEPSAAADPKWPRRIPARRPADDRTKTSRMSDLAAIATDSFIAAKCRDWGRIDIRVDSGGIPMVIDVTPNAYLAPTSSCAQSAEAGGVSYGDLLRAIVEGALARSAGSRAGGPP